MMVHYVHFLVNSLWKKYVSKYSEPPSTIISFESLGTDGGSSIESLGSSPTLLRLVVLCIVREEGAP